MIRSYTLLIIIALFSNACSSQDISGKWRGEFIIQDTVKVPINFEIDKNNKVFLINADERFETGTAKIKNDSLYIPLDQFDNELVFKLNKNIVTGVLRKQDGTFLAKLTAEKGRSDRFINRSKKFKNLEGKYDVQFISDKGNIEQSVGIFTQKENKLFATFLKPSGDTRYLEGTVEENKFYLSSFIGSTPGYYHGYISDNGELKGEQIGTKSRLRLVGQLNKNAALAHDTSLSTIIGSDFNFQLPDINGNTVSLNDEKYRNKVVIVSVTGTWCPNCIDEAKFLSPWYKENKNRGVEIILVHFERQSDTSFTRKVMRRFRDRFKIEYNQVFGGIAAKDSVAKALPDLKNFNFYPTTVIINRKGKVARTHTGFSGPATGRYYDDFVKTFNKEMDALLSE